MEIVFVHTWRACSDGGRKEAAGVGVGGWVEVWGGGEWEEYNARQGEQKSETTLQLSTAHGLQSVYNCH